MSSLHCDQCGVVDGYIHHGTCIFAGTVFKASKGQPSDSHQIGGDHYTKMSVQPWAAMESWMSAAEFEGFLRGNAIKYLARAGRKGDAVQDLKKAMHYLEKLIELKLVGSE
jgi:hypothetical protein